MPAKDRPRQQSPKQDAPKQDEATASIKTSSRSKADPSLEQDGALTSSKPVAAEELTPATTKQTPAAGKGKKGQQQSKHEKLPTKPPAAPQPEQPKQGRHQRQQEAAARAAQLSRTPHAVLLARGEQVGDLATLALQITSGMSGASKQAFTAAMTSSPPAVDRALEQVLKAAAMQGRTIIFSAKPDAFQPITEASPGVDDQQLECARGVVTAAGEIKCGCGLSVEMEEHEDHLTFQLNINETKLNRLWLERPLIKLQDLAVLCADPGTVKVCCLYCTSSKPEQGSGALSRCSTCNLAFHKTCYKEATKDTVSSKHDWQCISCRRAITCATYGCSRCRAATAPAAPRVVAPAGLAWIAAMAAAAAAVAAAAAMAPAVVVVRAAVIAAAVAVAFCKWFGIPLESHHKASTANSSNTSRSGDVTAPVTRRAAATQAQAVEASSAPPAAAISSAGGQADSTDSSPGAQLDVEDTATASCEGLDLGQLEAGDWVLPKWKGLQAADAALIDLLEAAGNADELRAQLHRGISRLNDLPAADEDVVGFKAGYRELRELGVAVRDALQLEAAEAKVVECRAQFAKALLVLLSDAQGEW